MKRDIIGGIIVTAILLGAFVFYLLQSPNQIDKPDAKSALMVHKMNTASDETIEKVRELSEGLSEIIESIDKGEDVEAHWDAFRDDPRFSEDAMNDLVNSVTYEPAEDARRVQQLLQIADRTEDLDALVYAQKILHDLYYWVYNRGDRDDVYWGATTAFEADSKNKSSLFHKITKYIEENKG